MFIKATSGIDTIVNKLNLFETLTSLSAALDFHKIQNANSPFVTELLGAIDNLSYCKSIHEKKRVKTLNV